jgi:hypothetical protein
LYTVLHTALIFCIGSILAIGAANGANTPRSDVKPLLATSDQVAAEALLRRLLSDPDLIQLQKTLKTELAATPRGRSKDGAATLDNAIAQWTNSLTLAEIVSYRPTPAILWRTDDTPRTWLGYTLGGVGTSGDNPDAIYRHATIDGGERYEVIGHLDPANRPAQITIELHKGDSTQPPKLNATASDLAPVASITERDLSIAADGSFRFTVGPETAGPNHLQSVPGLLTLGFRDILADWRQRPSRLTLHRLDDVPPRPWSEAELKQRIRADLVPFVKFWSNFPNVWFGGLTGNKITPVRGRNGGFGFIAAMSFDLADDQALVVTMDQAGSAYTGFQLIDPWMISADVTRNQVCLNNSQSIKNADGTVTYIIAPKDPGVANWLDTAGIKQGFGILRWHAAPADTTAERLVRDFRVVPYSEVARMTELVRLSPEQRKAQLADRAGAYSSRVR